MYAWIFSNQTSLTSVEGPILLSLSGIYWTYLCGKRIGLIDLNNNMYFHQKKSDFQEIRQVDNKIQYLHVLSLNVINSKMFRNKTTLKMKLQFLTDINSTA